MEDFKEELTRMFEIGTNNSSRKMNAGNTQENLIILHQNEFSIPSELSIKSIYCFIE